MVLRCCDLTWANIRLLRYRRAGRKLSRGAGEYGRLTGSVKIVHVFPDLYREGLNALPAHIAVIDRTGLIVLVNRAWTAFALANGGDPAKGIRSAQIILMFAVARRQAIPILFMLVRLWRGCKPCSMARGRILPWNIRATAPPSSVGTYERRGARSGRRAGAIVSHLDISAQTG